MTIARVAFVIAGAVLRFGTAGKVSDWRRKNALRRCRCCGVVLPGRFFVSRGKRKLRHLFVCSVNYGRADYELVPLQGRGSIGRYFSDNIFASDD